LASNIEEHLDRAYRWFRIKLSDGEGGKQWYYFRGLTSNELRIAGTRPDVHAAENFILSTVVLPKVDWDTFTKPGVPQRLIDEINNVSGLTDAGIPQEDAVAWITSEEGGMEALAVSMITGLSLKELRNADVFDYWRYLIIGKHMYENIYGRRAQETFQPQGSSDFSMNLPPDNSALLAMDARNPRGVVSEGGFTWSRSGR
jgi:hypothetical protein